jgi:acetolactate synthase-1/2/3 large subunit
MMNAAEMFVRCLENEGVTEIFGIPGEENLAVMDALLSSKIRFITTRHEQGAAFMADVYGRLTGKAGVCLATLGPGATNLITGFADAHMDRAPIVGIAGQGSTKRLHKESHQILDLVNLFEPISKYSTQIRSPDIVGEIVRKAFKEAQNEKPGGSFIDFPEDIADEEAIDVPPLKVQSPRMPRAPQDKLEQVARLISGARFPLIMAGNGVIRAHASEALVRFSEKLKIPVTTTFMAKGTIPFSHDYCLGAVGLGARDYIACGFDRADLIICVCYDMIEYHSKLWNPERTQRIVHIDQMPA